jgi:carbohydrate-selective porin OprB
LVFDGPLEHRPDDRAGIYASLADLSDAAGAGFASNELAIDAYYRLRWSERFWVQPEVQLIVDPSGSETISDALVLGLRIAAEF